MNAVSAIKQYQQVSISSSVMGASPHRLVQMLMEGALERIALARESMARNEIAMKGQNIGHAIQIVGGLQGSLNKEAGGEIAGNLSNLYDYMVNRLLVANSQNDESILDEVSGLMVEIKMGWDAMPDAYKQ
ncbi:flagellar export chaperone FliS [Methylobacter sp.]|uniref:flagellar export chaperone FliS n=1 Tax=Methylobacter sp. TaxID=2051955 RepID=UPI002489B85D|nr:flagellar export chaperone FliS [Methylobacter sp.]MDI1278862.1 flagellar export chaperone FliS [Methylobacter sp.]MDI1359638.1 flagellar export chaperone FliS [Methylobacter sp.]